MGRGRWLIDGFDLSRVAWNVTARSAGFHRTGLRGQNIVTPGVDGERWVRNKPLEAGTMRLSMFAVGSTPDGKLPASASRQQLCRDNLEQILGILGDGSTLHDVTRIETAGFGAVNLFPNPRSEDGVPGAVGYHQWLLNAAQRVQSDTEVRRNTFVDPNLVKRGTPTIAQNIFPDPFHRRYRTSSLITANWWGFTGYEQEEGFDAGDTDPAGWDRQGDITESIVFYTIGNPSTFQGQALQLKASAAIPANNSIGKRDPALFPQGKALSFRCRVRRAVSSAATLRLQCRAVWLNSDDSINSSSGWSAAQTVPTGVTWADLQLPSSVAGVCPTPQVTIEFRTVDALPSGQGFLLDNFCLADGGLLTTEAAPYVDGYLPWAEWNNVNTPGRSRANVNGAVDPTWVPGPANAFWAYAVSTPAAVNLQNIGFVAHRHAPAAGQTQTFTRTLAAPEVGRPYTLRFNALGCSGTTSTVELLTVEGGVATSRGSVSVVGKGTPGYWQESAGLEGVEAPYVGPTWTPTAGQTLQVRVTVPVLQYGYQVLLLRGIAVTDHQSVVDGSTASSASATYSWAGTQYQSTSIVSRPSSSSVTTRHTIDGTTGILSLGTYVRSLTENARQVYPMVSVTSVMRTAGITALVQARALNYYGSNQAQTQPQVRMVITGYNDANVLTQTWTGSVVNLPLPGAVGTGGSFVPVHVAAFDVNAATTKWQARLEVVGQVVGQYVHAQKVLLSDHAVPPDTVWFDGKTNGVFVGAVDASETVLRSPVPVGWSVGTGILGDQPTGDLTITSEGFPTRPPSVLVNVVRPSGTYLVGFEAATTRAGAVVVSALAGGVAVAETTIGRGAGGSLSLTDRMQGVLNVAQPFDQLSIRAVPDSTAGTSLSIRVGVGYVIDLAESHLPALDGNQVTNPVGLAGVLGWVSPTDTPTTVTTTVARGRMFSTGAGVFTQDRTFPVTSGTQLWTWARVLSDIGVALVLRFYNSAGAVIANTVVASDDAEARDRQLFGKTTVPPNATAVKVEVSNEGSSGPLSVLGVFCARVLPGRDYGPNLDPTVWLGFDGASGADSTGTQVQWDGAPDASTASTLPYLPSGWEPSGLLRLQASALRPPGSSGRVIAFPGFANAVNPPVVGRGEFSGFLQGFNPPDDGEVLPDLPEQTMIGRTAPVPTPEVYVSGQIAVARSTTSSIVTVRVYGCDDLFRTNPTLQYQRRVRDLTEIVSWRDVGLGQPFVYLEVEYVETEPNPGYAVIVDNVMILNSIDPFGSDYPPYFDGSSSSAVWLGTPDQSASKNYAGARHTLAEFPAAMDPESQAGGTRATFDTTGIIPSGVWEDLADSVFTATVTDPDVDMPLTAFAGSSAKNTSALVTVSLVAGTAPEAVVLTDVRSESWVQVGYQLKAGEVLTLDCEEGHVTVVGADGSERGLDSVMSRGGTSRLLVLTPFSTTAPPVLNLSSDEAFDGILQVGVTGRRKYVIA